MSHILLLKTRSSTKATQVQEKYCLKWCKMIKSNRNGEESRRMAVTPGYDQSLVLGGDGRTQGAWCLLTVSLTLV